MNLNSHQKIMKESKFNGYTLIEVIIAIAILSIISIFMIQITYFGTININETGNKTILFFEAKNDLEIARNKLDYEGINNNVIVNEIEINFLDMNIKTNLIKSYEENENDYFFIYVTE